MRLNITDVHTRKAFDIVSIYKHHDIELRLVSDKSIFHRILLSLIYLAPVYRSIDKDSFVLPTEDSTILKIIDRDFRLKLPPKESIDIALDKEKFSKFCEDEGFLVPKRYEIEELKKLDELPCPLIVKPKSGSGAVGIKFIDKKSELDSLDIDFSDYIIQERLDNPKDVEGAFFLFDEGKLVSFYSHKRLRTYPRSGGVTVLSKSDENLELKKIGEKLLQKLSWSGFAMVEFLYDAKDKEYKIIELNPRVWGSMMLSEFCGANMLKSYVDICAGKTPIIGSIKKDKKIRWMIPWDLGFLAKNFYKLDKKDTCYINFSYASKYSAILFLFYNILNPTILKKLLKKVLS